jgi:predicted RNase H-like HicB family nuclease
VRYNILVLVEQGDNNFSAYAPDVPGCIATGKTVEETVQNMREALEFHLGSIIRDGDPLPEPTIAHAQFVEIQIPDKVSAH